MDIESGEKESRYRKLRAYITVEPVMFATVIPLCLLSICLQNLILEKVSLQATSRSKWNNLFA